MKRLWIAGVLVSCIPLLAIGAAASDDVILRARCLGANVVPPIFGAGTANFRAKVHSDGSIDFKLDFQNLSANLIASHIHFAQRNVNGGVMVFLCGGGGQPACPAATAGTVTGTINAANVIGPAGQGIPAGALAAVLRVIEGGEGYVSLHTATFPAGEIRGQINVED